MHHVRLALLALLLAGCSPSWDAVRVATVDPVNKLLHRDYPRLIRENKLEQARAFYSAEALDDGIAADGMLMGPLVTVEQGEYVIESMTELDANQEVETICFVAARGRDKAGRQLTIEQRRRVRCQRGEDGWLIVASELTEHREFGQAGLRFVDEIDARGLAFESPCRGLDSRFGERHPYSNGSGLGVADVDGDGDQDILMVGTGELRLFLNDGAGRFRDGTAASGFKAPAEGLSRMAVFADVDNDGDPDAFVAVSEGEDMLWRNDGGVFTRVPNATSGLVSTGHTVSACFADVNGDGLLDLYAAAGGHQLQSTPRPVWKAKNAPSNRLFINRGDWVFEETTERAGVGHRGWAHAVSSCDYDGDGDVDLFVANDFGRNALFRNRGDGTFDDVTIEAGIVHHGAHMGCSWGDIDGDGDFDLFVTGMASNTRWVLDLPSFPAPAGWFIRSMFRPQVMAVINEMMHGNRLYQNQGDGTFKDISRRAGVRDADWAWGGLCLDADNDGRLDIYVPNGFISNEDPFDC